MIKKIPFALPKGRLYEEIKNIFTQNGLPFSFDKRKLISQNKLCDFFLVKNSDLPTYIHFGTAALGVCGEDVLNESPYELFDLHTFQFGSTTMCLAAKEGTKWPVNNSRIATKFTEFTQSYFHEQNISIQMVKLNGSVELAPLLGLAPYIVDLVETGNTLKANGLSVLAELQPIRVKLVANQALYKLHYKEINNIVDIIKEAKL